LNCSIAALENNFGLIVGGPVELLKKLFGPPGVVIRSEK